MGAAHHLPAQAAGALDAFDFEVNLFAKMTTGRLAKDPGFIAVQTLPGVGPILGAVFVAEIGEVTPVPGPTQLTSWAGLTPKHRESDTTVHRGWITKQGSRLVRWAAVEAVQRAGEHTRIGAYRIRVGDGRGRNIGTVAAARELIECVYYALRDGTVRRLAAPA